MKFHILSSPYSPVHIQNKSDPFSIAVVKFIKNMTKLGWNCIHYGIAGSEVDCEMVQCLPVIPKNNSDAIHQYNLTAGIEISKRKSSGDIILCFYGNENQQATLNNQDLIIVEPSIGYATAAVFAPYRIFVSNAQMHMFYGERNMLMDPSWTDAVIPNAFTPMEFEYSENKKDYVLCFGRVTTGKGVDIAIQATKDSGDKLIIAGPGSIENIGYNKLPDHVEYVGIADEQQRRALMRDAKAIIAPTRYVEPFGNMVIEGYFSGTPAITTDWGGFTETVIQGITGFRCRDYSEFITALKNVNSISSQNCRLWAEKNYTEEVIHKKFDYYFKKLLKNSGN